MDFIGFVSPHASGSVPHTSTPKAHENDSSVFIISEQIEESNIKMRDSNRLNQDHQFMDSQGNKNKQEHDGVRTIKRKRTIETPERDKIEQRDAAKEKLIPNQIQPILQPSAQNPIPDPCQQDDVNHIWCSKNTSHQQELKYKSCMSPPYIVMIQYNKNQTQSSNVGRYSPIAFAKKIREITPGPLTITANGQNSMKIICLKCEDANLILTYFRNTISCYSVSVPISLFFKKGFIKNVEVEINLPKIYDYMDEKSKAMVVGLKRRTNINGTPIDAIEITFNTPIVPRLINICDFLFQITPIIPTPRRCFCCQRFRHTADQCRSAHPVCEFCSQHHPTDICPNKNSEPKCSNCGGNHFASSSECPRYKYEFQVVKTCYTKNMGFQDAVEGWYLKIEFLLNKNIL